ncbi:transglutaminase-like domain-containing protein [Ammoniphilus resinae]|uniref:Transglutaminase-like domain-containing protein n=1 Tax=Ammoniphilus resinae TaxID=861532 RepID=A0ABS4GIL1_9BACL|nr:transglutaminase-like domain-containing protein [Ammoniphilus resinae]MBP1930064.1 hypothetical protein [Ammoniphilus resinae]
MKMVKGILIFLVLCEWLRPLPSLSHFENMPAFIVLMAIFCLVEVSDRLPLLLKWVVKACAAGGTIYFLFDGKWQLAAEKTTWLQYVKLEWLYNYQQIGLGDWNSTTALFRTVLFILILWLAVSIVYDAVLRRKQGKGFAFITLCYFILLDVTTEMETKGLLLQTVLLLLVLLSMIQLRFVERQGIQMLDGLRRSRSYWMLSTILLVGVIALFAYQLPKPGESAAQTFLWNTLASQPKKVGYESGDHRLGGPFHEDRTIVFYAETASEHYWRGESRDLYTGLEWKNTPREKQLTRQMNALLGQPLFPNIKTEDIETKVRYIDQKHNLIFSTGQVKQLKVLEPERGILYTEGNHDIQVHYPTAGEFIKHYEITEQLPLINEQELRNSSTNYPETIKSQDLQLPAGLPERVKELARELTADAADPYQKAVDIEQYLRLQGGYLYEQQDIPYVSENQDFVDQFLFETKKGYCDHFSSSMVVLLRAAGVPARYVKGFSTGDVNHSKEGLLEVTVRNKNAHSWPEVYFEGYGWVAFEPTPGFHYPTKKEMDQDAVNKLQKTPLPPPPPLEDKKDEQKKEDEQHLAGNESTNPLPAVLLILFFGGGLLFAYLKRQPLYLKWLYRKGMKAASSGEFSKVYLSLLKALSRWVSKRQLNESLSEYIDRIQIKQEMKIELKKLNAWYEKQLYGRKKEDPSETAECREILKKIIHHFHS